MYEYTCGACECVCTCVSHIFIFRTFDLLILCTNAWVRLRVGSCVVPELKITIRTCFLFIGACARLCVNHYIHFLYNAPSYTCLFLPFIMNFFLFSDVSYCKARLLLTLSTSFFLSLILPLSLSNRFFPLTNCFLLSRVQKIRS